MALKSFKLVGPVFLPILSALIVMVALVNASGESLSVFHVATFLLVMGLGLDYALFFQPVGGKCTGASAHPVWVARLRDHHNSGLWHSGHLDDSGVARHRLDRLCGIVLLPALHRADGKGEGACLRINDR